MRQLALHHLLPEEDALDDPDEDDGADPTLPGDLWFMTAAGPKSEIPTRRRRHERIVYSPLASHRTHDRRPRMRHARLYVNSNRKKDAPEWQSN